MLSILKFLLTTNVRGLYQNNQVMLRITGLNEAYKLVTAASKWVEQKE